jgi:Holliday junction resolvase RusA-like endonuclease
MSGRKLCFRIDAEPHPQGRPRAMRFGKGVRMHERNTDTEWKRDAAKQMLVQLPNDVFRPAFRSSVPLSVRIDFYFSCPKADRRVKNPAVLRWHSKKQDLDNLAKSVLDAGNGILWADDGQIVELSCRKMIAAQDDPPMVLIEVSEAEEVELS